MSGANIKSTLGPVAISGVVEGQLSYIPGVCVHRVSGRGLGGGAGLRGRRQKRKRSQQKRRGHRGKKYGLPKYCFHQKSPLLRNEYSPCFFVARNTPKTRPQAGLCCDASIIKYFVAMRYRKTALLQKFYIRSYNVLKFSTGILRHKVFRCNR